MEVARPGLDVAEDRPLGDDELPFGDDRLDVRVLKRDPLGRPDDERAGALHVDGARRDRVDRLSAAGRDVEAVVEVERPRAVHPVVVDFLQKRRARIAEVRPDRVLPAQRLEGPAVGPGAARVHEGGDGRQ